MAGTTVDHLTAQLKGCLVQVTGRMTGSGFFVAPNTVVTCAHVAGVAGERVGVEWQGEALLGVVRWASELTGAQVDKYPDMAVVDVTPPAQGHPSVWLDDQLPRTDAKLVVVGHAGTYGDPSGVATGWFTHGGGFDDMIRLTGDEIEPGMSGSPVLNTETGGVCAVTKASRRQGQAAGGVAVPVRALRRVMTAEPYRLLRRGHDEYHRRNQLWLRLCDDLPAAPGRIAGPADRELRLILATLPVATPDDHLADYHAIAGGLAAPVRHPMHDYGDVATELAGLVPAEDGFPHIFSYAIRLALTAPSPVADRLATWIRLTASAPGDGEKARARLAAAGPGLMEAAPAGVPSILVHVRPSGRNRRLYRCEIWSHDGTSLSPIDTESPPRTLDKIRAALRERLPELTRLGPGGERYPMIELVLPADLLDEDVEHWPRPARWASPAIGKTNAVVVREQERFEDDDEETVGNWQERWTALEGREVLSALLAVGCREQRDEDALTSRFLLARELGALVLPHTPVESAPMRTVLDVAFYTGIPIVIWRRHGCAGEPGTDHDDCAGARLAEDVAGALAKAGRDDVPERIMEMRNQAAAEGEPESGHDVVLIWDDPGRRLPRRRMEPPTGERHAAG